MALHGFKILVLLSVVAQYAALFDSRDAVETHHQRFRIHLEDDERLIIPRDATVKLLHSSFSGSDEFYPPFLHKSNKKPTKYLKHIPVVKLTSSLKPSDIEKNCFENEWKGKEVPLEELFRPVTLPLVNNFKTVPTITKFHEYTNFDDVKPVTENIEDDLKYDFRTKTHSI